MSEYTRRKFIEFLGWGTAGVVLTPTLLSSCESQQNEVQQSESNQQEKKKDHFMIQGISPTKEDALVLAAGLTSYVLVSWGDEVAEGNHFGFNNDFTCFIPLNGNEDGILWVNHEYVDPRFIHMRDEWREGRSLDEVKKEMELVGGSLLRIKKDNKKWQVVKNDPLNRKVSGSARIPFNWDEQILGSDHAIGTLANCSGGITPWNTVLTCEENYDSFYGEAKYGAQGRVREQGSYLWEKFFPKHDPEHYGWVVEIDPTTGAAQKHVALGRFAHECCTIAELPDKRIVAYSGDDANDECLYKFVSSAPGSLKEGTLYVANLEEGKWVSLDWGSSAILQQHFKNQTDVLVRAREAAKHVGGTVLDRPEDIEIDPETGAVLVTLTNNIPKENYHGSILKIEETDGKHDALTFSHSTFLAGGEETGFACPDNMAFDRAGNLWFTSDISGSKIWEGPYASFGNNGLFVVPRKGPQAGEVIQIASAPVHAELTGPWFSPDGKTLFLSVQHPGENSESLSNLSSNWPEGGQAIPKPSVVCIEGELLEKICNA